MVARTLLCIPVSSAISESNFSRAGPVLCKSRSSLNPSMLDDILVVKSNSDLVG
ncbi:hypothetical protein PF005_g23662 [Phytophthora fragariae]|uniref:HAT C-terminal dimerisation domain-containing protein n=1 Tax=Phytophthora fragariae TaxID=53985 RepID=A0A6A3W945_9STRA|nr:hypothetical protein PF003_g20518 [Phytophthora fragariae]KAE8926135.1 hypothetical protein PF009_g23668 [Phytophthora fragariae]KAE9079814.1 hypothetical protein PF007_g23300 [Phytophthora fragariae]KAE9100847.1 hypothetical protein PF006_g22807 [Phytophthora fragariae]KAE9179504.1 hypothetical protein PF005_g23662 [Phytophthora fragariae]